MENKLIFNGKEYELIETPHDRFIVFDHEMRYGDVGINVNPQEDLTRYECYCIRISNKFYALKLLEKNGNLQQ